MLDNEEVMIFLKITTCNCHLKAIFENYARKAMKDKLDYTRPMLTLDKFKNFLQQEQKENPNIIAKWIN